MALIELILFEFI